MSIDRNWKSYVRETNPDLSALVNPIDPKSYQDIAKFSFCQDVVLQDKTIDCGTENNVDAVRGKNYLVQRCWLQNGGTAAVVMKGAIDTWEVKDCVITPHSETEIEVGQFDNYWYPGRAPTRNGSVTGCRTPNASPVRVTCWNADVPHVDQYATVKKVSRFVWFPYFCLRYLQVRFDKTVPWVWAYDPPQVPTKNGVAQ